MDSLSRLTELQDLTNIDLSLPSLARAYLEGSQTDTTTYAAMRTALDAVVASKTGSRIVVTQADGTVVYDSKNNNDTIPETSPKYNKAANSSAKSISENHNSRPAIITACLNSSGIGMEQKYSTSTGQFEQYLAIRIGVSPTYAIGVIRYSLA
jgi:hypothetical protein